MSNKVVVIKLSDPEEKSLMRDYLVNDTKKPQKPSPQETNKPITFDELSFANPVESVPARAPVPSIEATLAPAPAPSEQNSLNLSLLAASREVTKKKAVTFRPPPPPRPEPVSLKPVAARRLPAIRTLSTPKKRVLRFKNEEQDGYKIGFLPSIRSEPTTSIPSNPRSLSKMEKLLGIKVRLQGNHG